MKKQRVRALSHLKSDDVLVLFKASSRYDELREEALAFGYKHGWVYHRMVEEFGKEVARKICPTSFDDYDNPF